MLQAPTEDENVQLEVLEIERLERETSIACLSTLIARAQEQATLYRDFAAQLNPPGRAFSHSHELNSSSMVESPTLLPSAGAHGPMWPPTLSAEGGRSTIQPSEGTEAAGFPVLATVTSFSGTADEPMRTRTVETDDESARIPPVETAADSARNHPGHTADDSAHMNPVETNTDSAHMDPVETAGDSAHMHPIETAPGQGYANPTEEPSVGIAGLMRMLTSMAEGLHTSGAEVQTLTAALQCAEARCGALEQEVGTLRMQLEAARVANKSLVRHARDSSPSRVNSTAAEFARALQEEVLGSGSIKADWGTLAISPLGKIPE
jgi:hypothetical protein